MPKKKSGAKKIKVLVTGGAGFIGSHMVDALLSLDHKVTVVDNLSSGRKENIAHNLNNKNFKFIKEDLLHKKKIAEMFKKEKPDIVFHFSANPDAQKSISDPELDLKQQTIATHNVLEAMRLSNSKKIILSSSGTIYGETPIVALKEDYGPCFPISLYGAGKLAQEGLITAYCGTFGFQAWIFRFANVIGSRRRNGVVADFIKKLIKTPGKLIVLGDGSQEKPYILVDELVEAILFGLERANKQINVYNIGVRSTTTVKQIATIVIQKMGLTGKTKIEYTGGKRGWLGDIPQVRYDVKKLTKLGWKAKRSSTKAVIDAAEILVKELKG